VAKVKDRTKSADGATDEFRGAQPRGEIGLLGRLSRALFNGAPRHLGLEAAVGATRAESAVSHDVEVTDVTGIAGVAIE
jgi:hypothetical protein